MNTPAQSPDEVQAFAHLDRCRAELARCEADVRIHRNILRRWARTKGCRVPAARCLQWEADRAAWDARYNAEHALRSARNDFRHAAMFAALTRVVEADRRIRAA